jgi:acyl carrier protein
MSQVLRQHRADMIAISSIPSARTWQPVSAWQKINDKDAPATTAEVRSAVKQLDESLVEPDDIARIAVDSGYTVTIEWSRDSSEPLFDAIFRRTGAAWAKPAAGQVPIQYATLDSYANNPLRQAILRQLVPELKLWLKKQLPEYMVPSTYVVLDAFPLTPNGKVDRRALPAPGAPRLDTQASYVAPRTDTEKKLAEIWAEVLRIDHIGVNHDFFALGGHSLLATQVISRIQRQFNRELPLQALFEHPTVAGLSKEIDEMKMAEPISDSPMITRANRGAFRAKRSSL